MNKLEQLRKVTTVVADTGEIEAIRQYKPVDATTNPSLLLKVVGDQKYGHFLDEAVAWSRREHPRVDDPVADIADRLAVLIGTEIAAIVPGRVSTEVSASRSFDATSTIGHAHKLIALYEEQGLSPERVLIKTAATWEGIRAAEVLEKEGIQCNLTLLFSFAQAVACADAGVYLISPFVGRIYDWYKARDGRDYSGTEDPGVQSVTRIFNYYKQHGYDTVVMGASFRNAGQIEALAGCDRLTISPQLLEELSRAEGELSLRLDSGHAVSDDPRINLDEVAFRWQHNEDAMATEKLAEGIRKFHEDEIKLHQLIAERLNGREKQ